jgi:hypothetical protein
MEDQTRFWIAQEVAETKYTADLKPLFKLGKKIAHKQPKTLITDGAPNFHEVSDEGYSQTVWHFRGSALWDNYKLDKYEEPFFLVSLWFSVLYWRFYSGDTALALYSL